MVEPDETGAVALTPALGAAHRGGLPSAPASVEAPPVTMIYRSAESVEPPSPPPPPPPPKEVATLSLEGRALPLSRPRTVIGRSRECEIRLDDANVSRQHCEVLEEAGGWSVVDLGSTNGTELNGRRIDRAGLSDGDRITVGGSDLVFGLTRS